MGVCRGTGRKSIRGQIVGQGGQDVGGGCLSDYKKKEEPSLV